MKTYLTLLAALLVLPLAACANEADDATLADDAVVVDDAVMDDDILINEGRHGR